MTSNDDSYDALRAEILANVVTGAAFCENDFRRELSAEFDKARREKGMSIRDLAREMKTSLSQVQRLLHVEIGGDDSLTLRTLFRAAHVLDLKLIAHVRPKHFPSVNNVVPFGCWSTAIGSQPCIAQGEAMIAETSNEWRDVPDILPPCRDLAS